MRREAILHPGLCEQGFPVPEGSRRIGLALADDLTAALNVLRATAAEFMINRVLIT